MTRRPGERGCRGGRGSRFEADDADNLLTTAAGRREWKTARTPEPSRNAGRRTVDPIDRFTARIRIVMRQHPAHALAFRNALYAEGLDRLDQPGDERRRARTQRALETVDAAFERHIYTYRDPAPKEAA